MAEELNKGRLADNTPAEEESFDEMRRFYYTFGSADDYPFGREDYVVVEAWSQNDANRIFRTHHPDKNAGVLNCADYYTEAQFREMKDAYYPGRKPTEILKQTSSHINVFMSPEEIWYPKEDAFVLLSVVYMTNGEEKVPSPGDFHKGYKRPERVTQVDRFTAFAEAKKRMDTMQSKITRIKDSVGNTFYMIEEVYMVETLKRTAFTGETDVEIAVVDYPKELVYQAQDTESAKTSVTQEELNRMAENHKHYLRKDCEGWENMKADFSGMDLRGMDFSCRELSGAIFTGANLRGANLMYTSAAGADFHGADLSMANGYAVDLLKADLRRVRMEYANMESANMKDANLLSVRAKGVIINHARLDGATAKGADFSEARMGGINAEKTDFSLASFVNADLTQSRCDGSVFKGADFHQAIMRSIRLFDADLTGANLRFTDFSFANISGADLRDANITGAKMYGASSAGAKLGPSVQNEELEGAEKKAASSL